MPQSPFPIYGFAPDNGVNVLITMKNLSTAEEETVYSASDGSFLCDPANLPSGYDAEKGDIIRITAPALGYYAQVIVNTELYPDGIAVVLTNNPVTMATVIPSGVMAKFPTLGSRINGNVSVDRGGLG